MNISVDPAAIEELQQLLPLVRAYHEFEQIERNDSQRDSALRRLLADKRLGGIWLIRVDATLAGYIALCKGFSIEFGGFDAFVDEFYLMPRFRGRGVGRYVLDEIRSGARALDIGALHLEVARDNLPARRLYAAAGFEAREKYVLMSTGIAT